MRMSASAISAIPYGPLYLRPMANTHMAQGPVIEAFQGTDSSFDLALATPVCPEARNQTPRQSPRPSCTPATDDMRGEAIGFKDAGIHGRALGFTGRVSVLAVFRLGDRFQRVG